MGHGSIVPNSHAMRQITTPIRSRQPRASIAILVSLSLSFFPIQLAAETDKASEKVRFATLDQNGDGLITKPEMTAWRASKFKTRDLDHDGIITRHELLQEARDGARALTWEETFEFLLSYDRNGNQEVSYEEVAAAIEAKGFFEMIDWNGSGTITKEEADGWLDVTQPTPPPAAPDEPQPSPDDPIATFPAAPLGASGSLY